MGVLPTHRLPVLVIVVGNVRLGGSGKTPLVMWLAQTLRAAGERPGILSRGHGGERAKAKAAPVPVNAQSDPAQVGDEPVMLAQRCAVPVWVGVDRVAAGRALLSAHPDCTVLICDDGLQHQALARDLEIALVDARGFGNGWLFPAGPLREPATRLNRVDAVVVRETKHMDGFAMQLVPRGLVNLVDPARTLPLTALHDQRVHAVAGIGVPQRFFAQLRAFGMQVIEHPFDDHHPFVAADLHFDDAHPVILTEKDAVKCTAFAQAHWWSLPVDAELDPAFGVWMHQRLQQLRGAPDGHKTT